MKIKIQLVEGFDTTTWRNPIVIESDDYPQLEGMTQEQILEYLNKNSDALPAVAGDDADNWSLYDELINQEKELEKEKNYESSIVLWSK